MKGGPHQQAGYFIPTIPQAQHIQRYGAYQTGGPQGGQAGQQPRWTRQQQQMGGPQGQAGQQRAPGQYGSSNYRGQGPRGNPSAPAAAQGQAAAAQPGRTGAPQTASQSANAASRNAVPPAQAQVQNSAARTAQQPRGAQQQQQRQPQVPGIKYQPNIRNAPQPQAQNFITQQGAVPAQQPIAPEQGIHIQGQEPLTASMLASANPQEQKQMLGEKKLIIVFHFLIAILFLGERLFPLISSYHHDMAGKITGMLLEIDNSELLHMLEHPQSLKAKVDEAVAVLQVKLIK